MTQSDLKNVINAYSDKTGEEIANRAIDYLKIQKDVLLSDNSDLFESWKDIYKQDDLYEQHFERGRPDLDLTESSSEKYFLSTFWNIFDKPTRDFISLELNNLYGHETICLWLVTKQGINWRYPDYDDDLETIPYSHINIQDDLIGRYIYNNCEGWLKKPMSEWFEFLLSEFLEKKIQRNRV